jgi:hypothetical protein
MAAEYMTNPERAEEPHRLPARVQKFCARKVKYWEGEIAEADKSQPFLQTTND